MKVKEDSWSSKKILEAQRRFKKVKENVERFISVRKVEENSKVFKKVKEGSQRF